VSYTYTLPDGRQMTQEEWDEYKKQKFEAERLAEWQDQHEAARLVSALGEAYKACSGFIKSRPHLVRKVGDDQAQENDLYQKLRRNLERADSAPRCEKVREDGTYCQSPRMNGYDFCYAHDRMLRVTPRKLGLPPLEDANAIQMAIMMVQSALIDDEISEKKAGLLFYSIQIAAGNVKHTTYTQTDKEVVTEMPEEGTLDSSQRNENTYHGDTEARRTAEALTGEASTTEDTGSGSGDLVIGGSGDLVDARGGAKKKPKSDSPRSDSRKAVAEQISHPLATLEDSR
jgi:hypothetical protein